MELNTEQLFQTIVEKAWEDDVFKSALLTNPVSAIEDLTAKSINLPEGKNLAVLDQTDATTVYINIPAKPSLDDVELSEDDLDIISGGGDPVEPILQSALNNSDPLADVELGG